MVVLKDDFGVMDNRNVGLVFFRRWSKGEKLHDGHPFEFVIFGVDQPHDNHGQAKRRLIHLVIGRKAVFVLVANGLNPIDRFLIDAFLGQNLVRCRTHSLFLYSPNLK